MEHSEQPTHKTHDEPHHASHYEQREHYAPREPREQRPHKPRAPGDENTIFIGKKEVMAYVLAVVTQFTSSPNEVKIKARGKAISRAVDVTQIVKNRFIPTMRISDFKAETEEVPNEDGTTSRVSSLTLTLTK
ncbi:DNA-binding protein Alba [Candidatus Micrarchaeota archaeon]|nr:DNA-binding protein Alba [Candidatus Micrarchaeota archaeon]